MFGGTAKLVALGSSNLCVLDATARARCVGDWPLQTERSSRNQDIREPVEVTGLTGVRAMVIEHPRGCAIVEGGAVRCWGNATPTPFGWMGASPGKLEAVEVAGVRDAIDLALGWAGSCALIRGGSVICWGGPFSPHVNDRSGIVAPPRTLPLRGVIDISAAKKRGCAALDDGTVSCWGDELPGDLTGRGAGEERPIPVPGLAGVVEVSVGNEHACARTQLGEIFCWGANGAGELGDGTFEVRKQPVRVLGITDAAQVVASHGFSCALTRSGQAFCWGENANASLGCELRGCQKRSLRSTFGDSEIDVCPRPQAIRLPFVPTSISVGSSNACARSASGEVACWGRSLTTATGGCNARPL